MKNKEEQIEMLDTLLERCNDSIKGYEKAADASDNRGLKLHLHNLSLERKDFSHAIGGIISELGGKPSDSGTVKGALHRNWLDMKALVSNTSEEAIVGECQRGDQRLVEDYMETISKSELPRAYESVLARQLGNVQARLERMSQIESSLSQ